MSRTNPNADRVPNPAECVFEWKGGDGGHLQYYDKDKKENVDVKTPFSFIVLDQLATIGGYNKKLKTGLYANEVRDTRAERLVVKYFAGDKVAEGFYADIKDTVVAKSGHFVAKVYIAFKDGDGLKIGAIRFQGCSLGPWFEFTKANSKAIYEQGITIAKGALNEEGQIPFTPCVFALKPVSPETDTAAGKLQEELKEYLKVYFSRNVAAKTEQPEQASAGDELPENPPEEQQAEQPTDSDDVPF